ncbi:MAG TPA: hypothetical protein VES88_12020 [Gemmatimonadaceae bacterium]|nr:hypothetical protein [Gemmatimonadaceae bacterium]
MEPEEYARWTAGWKVELLRVVHETPFGAVDIGHPDQSSPNVPFHVMDDRSDDFASDETKYTSYDFLDNESADGGSQPATTPGNGLG